MIHVVFWTLATLAVTAGIAVFRVTSMARATYALAVSFVAVGLALLLVHLDYVGVVVVLMMIMEMAVMAVYMVMFMGMNPALMPMAMTHDKRRAAFVAFLVFAVLAAGAVLVPWPRRRGSPPPDSVVALGTTMMESKMLVMMTVSPLLVATIVAGLVLASPRTRYDRLGEDLRGRGGQRPGSRR